MDSVGLISLGLQVCQGLVRYYESWKDCPRDVAATLESLSRLEKTFDILQTATNNPALTQEIKLLVEQRIDSCRDGVVKLQKRLDKFRNAPDGHQSKISSVIQRTLYPFKESTLAKMREIVRDLTDNLDLALSASQFNMHINSLSTLENISKQINTVSLAQTDDNRVKILDWLSPADDGAQHSDYISARGSGTGQWLLDSSEFREWLHGSHLTLCCKGIPGSGKTMMTAIVIDHLLKQYSGRSAGIAFLYCNYRKHETQKAINLLASLLRQLSANSLSLPESVTALYKQHFPCGTRPSLEEISKSLHSVVETFSRIIIIIDALDECRNDDGTRSLILSENRKLQSHFKTKLMATSRDIPEVTQEFHGDIEVEVRASDADLNRYLDDQMTRLPKFIQRNDELKQKIKRNIIESAKGMFLLAKLHVESLQDKRTEKLINGALQNLPKGSQALNESYGSVLERIDGQLPEDRKLAKKIISWITYARRPLTTRELQHALAVEPETTELDETNLGDVEDMVSVCAGLVTIDRESNVVRLVHYTTQQYFEDVGMRWIPDATEMIASTCLTYLSFDAFKSKPCKTDAEIEADLSNFIFLDYSARYWGLYVPNIQNKMKDQILSFLQDQTLLCFWSRVMAGNEYGYNDSVYVRYRSSRFYNEKITPMHVASKFDLDVVMAILLKNKVEVDVIDFHVQTPLSIAAQYGSEKTMKILLTRENINPNFKDFKSSTPLSHAAQYGHETIVRLLIAHVNVEIDCKDDKKRTPLSLAAGRGHETVVKLLIEREEVDLNSEDSFARTPCSYAAEAGHETVIRLLMTRGVDINFEDFNKRTPLSYAAENGHEPIVKLLTARNDIVADSRDVDNQTPLCYAAKYGHENIVNILISRNDVDADSKDFNNRTPLSWAAGYGYETIVKSLIVKNDVDVNSKDSQRLTPLTHAAMNNHETIVECLIARDDIDADPKDFYGQTPLSWAAGKGCETIAKFLIARNDVDANSKDRYGRTPLSWAAAMGCETIAKFLIATNDVDADSKNSRGRTPLSWAAEYGRAKIVELLISRKDVEVNSKDNDGKSPLSYALSVSLGLDGWGHSDATQDYETVIKLLQDRQKSDCH